MTELPPSPSLGPPHSYFHAVWHAAREDEPVEWYDELDVEGYSIRCVRKYRDGRLEAHSYQSENWRDVMPEGPFPPTEDIDRNPEFSARDISKTEFEIPWSQANRSSTEPQSSGG
ncbi:conserved hypothetical protein [Bradyrhizobium sp. STM 3843]|uniref:DUF6881 domain-containing protein n=1 Tax=Bradyrhizobium sp. STM 3843 TaxID=551947 RepID=UPI000240559F|nr:hypothetical protein [Bradyrhizobium sp. STM 3843]CCE10022.1 conserved hypothetical protein [Bradyrhizobium sp. STM 3843]